MARIDILKRINQALNPDGTSVDFSVFDKEVEKLKTSLKEKIQAQTIDDVKIELERFQKKINFESLTKAIDQTEENINGQIKKLSEKVDGKLNEFKTLVANKEIDNKGQLTKITDEITSLRNQISSLTNEKNGEIKVIKDNISELSMFSDRMDRMHRLMMKDVDTMKTDSTSKGNLSDKKLETIKGELEELAKDLRSRLASLANNRGGNANRQIKIGGVDYLTRYTDINLIAGTAMSLVVANDDASKRVNITFNASGGGTTFETPVGVVDDSNTSFTVSNIPKYINVNGSQYTEGLGIYTSYLAGTITLSAPVGTGGFIISAY